MNPRKEIAAEAARWWRQLLESSIREKATGQPSNPFDDCLPMTEPSERAINKFERYLTSMIARELKKKTEFFLESNHGSVSGLIFWSANVSGISLHYIPQGHRMWISLNEGVTIDEE